MSANIASEHCQPTLGILNFMLQFINVGLAVVTLARLVMYCRSCLGSASIRQSYNTLHVLSCIMTIEC